MLKKIIDKIKRVKYCPKCNEKMYICDILYFQRKTYVYRCPKCSSFLYSPK